MKSCMENMIFLMMIIASAWSRIVENSTQDIDDRFDCYPSCHSWQICCPSSGDCVDYLQDCDYCKTNCDCGDCEGRYTICCKGECVMYEHGCDLRYCGVFNPCDIGLICCDEVCVDADEGCQTTTTSTTSTSGPNCNDDFTICTDLGFDNCCAYTLLLLLWWMRSLLYSEEQEKAPGPGSPTRDADDAGWTGSATRISYFRVCCTTTRL